MYTALCIWIGNARCLAGCRGWGRLVFLLRSDRNWYMWWPEGASYCIYVTGLEQMAQMRTRNELHQDYDVYVSNCKSWNVHLRLPSSLESIKFYILLKQTKCLQCSLFFSLMKLENSENIYDDYFYYYHRLKILIKHKSAFRI